MICPRCGERAAKTLETRRPSAYTVRRRHQCPHGHSFTTIEIPVTVFHRVKHDLCKHFIPGVERNALRWARDREIAVRLNRGENAKDMAVEFELSKTALYLAARRGKKSYEADGVPMPGVPDKASGSASHGAAHAGVLPDASALPLRKLHVPAPADVGPVHAEPGRAGDPGDAGGNVFGGLAGRGSGRGLEHEGQADEGLAA